MLETLRDLAAYCAWADAVLLHTWGKGPARDEEELRRRLEHMLGVQEGFVAVIRGNPAGGPPNRPPAPYAELKERAAEVHGAMNALLASLTDADLERQVQIPWIPDPPCVLSVKEALLQATLHSQHHRGQCMTRLKDLGGEPKNVDWLIWVWKERPAPRWG